MVAYLVGTDAKHNVSSTILDFDSYDRIRKQAEQLHYHQMLLEKDLAAQDTLNRQLIDELAGHVQALDQANVALQEAQRRLLSEGSRSASIWHVNCTTRSFKTCWVSIISSKVLRRSTNFLKFWLASWAKFVWASGNLSSTCVKSAEVYALQPSTVSGWALQFNHSRMNGRNELASRWH